MKTLFLKSLFVVDINQTKSFLDKLIRIEVVNFQSLIKSTSGKSTKYILSSHLSPNNLTFFN